MGGRYAWKEYYNIMFKLTIDSYQMLITVSIQHVLNFEFECISYA